jgi:signal transduction histidine kinase
MVRQIREAREALARALRAKMDFLADASHELRTPLTVVHTNAQVGAQLEEEPAQREIFEDIVNESSQMSRMVENLLFLARSDSESPLLEMEIIAVPTFLAALKGRAETLARGRGASFEANLSGEGEFRADPARLEQAVLILVDNAAKYSPAGERVTLSANTESGELLIRVEDRGPGIPEEHLPHIFERFYHADKARARKQGGAGLGLSIAQTIVQAHGGRIEAESHVGEGMKMSLHLPLAAQLEQGGRSATWADKTAAHGNRTMRKTADPTHERKSCHGASIFTDAGEARSGEAAHKQLHANEEVSLVQFTSWR